MQSNQDLMKENEYSFVGLFSGCGGADYGFHKNGFKCLGSIDHNSIALKVLEENLEVPTYMADLTNSNVPDIIGKKYVDVVFSGAPCQGFSTAGNRIYDDPRNSLLVKGGEIALELNAKVFISENVMGSLSGPFKDYWDTLEEQFLDKGYKTQFIKINCLDIGMAQMRKRVLFFAWKTKGTSSINWPESIKPKNLGQSLEGLNSKPKEEGFIELSQENAKIAVKIGQDQKLCNVRGGNRAVPTWEIPEVFGQVDNNEKDVLVSLRSLRRKNRKRSFGDADPVDLDILVNEHGLGVIDRLINLEKKGYVIRKGENSFDLTRTFNGKYKRLSMNEPCTTVDTRFGNPIYFLHPTENRGFTVREAARIQGFPDDFKFDGSIREKYRMIGNAVPPPLSVIIAKVVREQLLP